MLVVEWGFESGWDGDGEGKGLSQRVKGGRERHQINRDDCGDVCVRIYCYSCVGVEVSEALPFFCLQTV